MRSRFCSLTLGLIFFTASIQVLSGQAPASEQTTRLRAFAKLYGYMRYFHPSDQAAQIDWDAFAIYGAGEMIDRPNGQSLKSTLERLFHPIAPTLRIYAEGETPPETVPPPNAAALKTTAWQHRGLGQDEQGLYISARSHFPKTLYARSRSGFGTVTQWTDAAPFRGKEVRLRAAVRAQTDRKGHQAQLWLRVDRIDGNRGFFDNMSDRPIVSQAWQAYEITGTVAQDAEKIYFGCLLLGYGTAWVDGFELAVREPGQPWEPVAIANPGFEKADLPEGWSAHSEGYAYRAIEVDDAPQGRQSLKIERMTHRRTAKLFDRAPSPGEKLDKPLGAGLRCRAPLALYFDEKGTLGSPEGGAFKQLQARIKAEDQEPRARRAADAIIAWNAFQHFYPYFDQIDADWDRELTLALERMLEAKDEDDALKTLRLMTAALQDGHAQVAGNRTGRFGMLPIRLTWAEGQLVVTASERDDIQAGDSVLAIDGAPAAKVLAQIERYVSGSPQWRRQYALRELSWGRLGERVQLRVRRDGRVIETALTRGKVMPPPEFTRPVHTEIRPGVHYVDLTRVKKRTLIAKTAELSAANGVVFDLRGYPRNTHFILQHLIDQPVRSAHWKIPLIVYPDQAEPVGYGGDEERWTLTPAEPRFKGRIVFLTDARAISYAESILGIVEHYRLGDIVGQPTAGANGNVNQFWLPGGYQVAWTGMRVVKHDGSQHHLVGIQPTVPAARTIKGIAEGRDELLEKALTLLDPSAIN